MEIIDASLPNSQGRRLTSALAGFWWQPDHPVSQFLPCVSDLAIGRKQRQQQLQQVDNRTAEETKKSRNVRRHLIHRRKGS
jgi:hypothetical protein